jgi:hypothetical protein
MMIFIVFVVLVCWAHQALVRNFELWSCVCVLHASPQSTNNSLVVDVGSASVGDLLGHERHTKCRFFVAHVAQSSAAICLRYVARVVEYVRLRRFTVHRRMSACCGLVSLHL